MVKHFLVNYETQQDAYSEGGRRDRYEHKIEIKLRNHRHTL
jgi:hypothetical protein